MRTGERREVEESQRERREKEWKGRDGKGEEGMKEGKGRREVGRGRGGEWKEGKKSLSSTVNTHISLKCLSNSKVLPCTLHQLFFFTHV